MEEHFLSVPCVLKLHSGLSLQGTVIIFVCTSPSKEKRILTTYNLSGTRLCSPGINVNKLVLQSPLLNKSPFVNFPDTSK